MPKKIKPILRREDWDARLFAYVEENRAKPFKWGVRDCCLIACDGVKAVTGYDPAKPEFRGKYKDELEAMRLVKKYRSVEGVAVAICKRLGFDEVRVSMAHRGDVMLYDIAEGKKTRPALGFYLGADSVFAGLDGFQFVPTAQCRRAWAVARLVPEAGRIL